MGIVVADPHNLRRAETATAIRAIIQGQLPGAQIDAVPIRCWPRSRPASLWPGESMGCGSHRTTRYAFSTILRARICSARSPQPWQLAALFAPRRRHCAASQPLAVELGWRGHATALLLTLRGQRVTTRLGRI